MDGRGSGSRHPLAGVLVAGVVAALGGAALADGWQSQARSLATCEPTVIGDCLGWGYPLLLAGPFVVLAAVWLTLRVLGTTHPEWGTVLGAAATAGALLLWEAGHPRWVPPPSDLAALLAGAGVTVGVAVAAVPLPRLIRLVSVVVLAVPFAVYPVLARDTRRTVLTDDLTRVGLPPLVAEADGYRVEMAWADPRRRFLSVSVGRQGNPRTDLTSGDRSVSIVVVPVPAGFAPPERCGPTVAELPPSDGAATPPVGPPCRPAGPDHWVRVENDDEVHLLRRGVALVMVSAGRNASDRDVAAVAGSLVEVTPRRLAELAAD